MAVITADQINYSDSGDFSVGFFSLKNDGDEAIVRIMCDSMSDLEIMTVHPITVGASAFPNRQVNCLRTPRDPLEMCPLCSAGEPVRQKVFIKMLQYDPITKQSSAVVWDRTASAYVPKLKSFIDNYGPLSHIMCKIIRHGTGKNTQYDIIPNINPMEFNETNYPINTEAFKDFSVLGRMVMDKNAEEIMEFMRVGAFPEKVNTTNNIQNTTPYQSSMEQEAQNTFSQYQHNQYTSPIPNTAYMGDTPPIINNPQGYDNISQSQPQQQLERPVRYR